MPPDRAQHGADRRGLAAEWLLFAETDLMFAQRTDLPGALLEAYCYHAQQAAGKGLKAGLVALGEDPPRTHNMALLLGVLGQYLDVTGLEPATELSAYAVIGRYPGSAERVSVEQYERALWLARLTYEWARGSLTALASRSGPG